MRSLKRPGGSILVGWGLAIAICGGLAPVARAQQCQKDPGGFTAWFVANEVEAVLPAGARGRALSVTLDDSHQTRVAMALHPCSNPDVDPGVLASYRVTLVLRGGTDGIVHLIGRGDRPSLAIVLKPCEEKPYEGTLQLYAAASVAFQLAAEIDAVRNTGARPACGDVWTAEALLQYSKQRLSPPRNRVEEGELLAEVSSRLEALTDAKLCAPADAIASNLRTASPVMGAR